MKAVFMEKALSYDRFGRYTHICVRAFIAYHPEIKRCLSKGRNGPGAEVSTLKMIYGKSLMDRFRYNTPDVCQHG